MVGPGVADQFQEVRFLLHDDRLIPILEEVAGALVAPIESAGVAREEASHAPGQGALARPDQEVGVVREEGPGVHREGPVLREGCEAGDDVGPAGIIPDYDTALDAAHRHVAEDPGGIQPGSVRHSGRIVVIVLFGNVPYSVFTSPIPSLRSFRPVPYSVKGADRIPDPFERTSLLSYHTPEASALTERNSQE